MDTGSGEPRDSLRQAIDDEINSLEQSIRVLKTRRNALAPISCLPPETLAAIFSFLTPSANRHYFSLEWICFSHVCRQWRETALNYPRLWSHITFHVNDSYSELTPKLAPAAIAEIPARAKTVSLHLDLELMIKNELEWIAIVRQIDAHISHTRYLRVSGLLLSLEPLVSSAPILESLSLMRTLPGLQAIPSNLFNCSTPSLTSLELEGCDISWKSPLLKGLQDLKIRSTAAHPELDDWLDALNEMSQLKTLSLHYGATPAAPPAPFISQPLRTVTLPSLTKFHITTSAKSCTLALAHLVMPALAWLHVDVYSEEDGAEDVRPLIPYVARNVCGLQDTEPLRSILISGKNSISRGEDTSVNVFAWIMPDADLDGYDPIIYRSSIPARLTFTATSGMGSNRHHGVDTGIIDALLTLLPVDSVSTLIVHYYAQLSKEFWLIHAPRWPSLEQVHLAPTAVKAFTEMLAEDAPPDGPRLPSLTKLILIHVRKTWSVGGSLCSTRSISISLNTTFVAPEHTIKLLRDIVIEKVDEDGGEFATWGPKYFNLRSLLHVTRRPDLRID